MFRAVDLQANELCSIYSVLFDSVINAYLIENCGHSPSKSKEVGLVVHSSCSFFDAVAYPAILDLGLRVTQIGSSSVTYEAGVFEQGIEGIKAIGTYTHVFVDRKSLRPAKQGMPESIRNGLSLLLRRPKI